MTRRVDLWASPYFRIYVEGALEYHRQACAIQLTNSTTTDGSWVWHCDRSQRDLPSVLGSFTSLLGFAFFRQGRSSHITNVILRLSHKWLKIHSGKSGETRGRGRQHGGWMTQHYITGYTWRKAQIINFWSCLCVCCAWFLAYPHICYQLIIWILRCIGRAMYRITCSLSMNVCDVLFEKWQERFFIVWSFAGVCYFCDVEKIQISKNCTQTTFRKFRSSNKYVKMRTTYALAKITPTFRLPKLSGSASENIHEPSGDWQHITHDHSCR